MARWGTVLGAVVLAAAVGMLGVGVYTGYELVRHPSSRLHGLGSPLNVSYSGPNASFAWSSQGYNVTFTDTSTDNGSTLTNWVWDFGDGTPDYDGPTPPPHTYVTTCPRCTEGVSLAVTDAEGHGSAANANVLVQRVGSSSGVGTSVASQLHLPSLGPLSSGLLGAVELVVVMLLIGASAAKAARNLLRREPEPVQVPVRGGRGGV
jgi:PKD domain